jgi:hypothetical protein
MGHGYAKLGFGPQGIQGATGPVGPGLAPIVNTVYNQLKVFNTGTYQVVATYGIPNNSTVAVDTVVLMKQSTGLYAPNGAMFKLSGAWYRNGGSAAVEVKGPTILDANLNSSGTGWTAGLVLNVNTVEVRSVTNPSGTVTVTAMLQAIEGPQL